MADHTPIPWRVDSAGIVYDAKNRSIAHSRYSNITPEDEQSANAELIVRAVNSHEELVAALEDATKTLELVKGLTIYDPPVELTIRIARAALAKAHP